jgi:UDP-3-O-[3-hydroxymyristoyl] N-acetylglucosamine deacetylase
VSETRLGTVLSGPAGASVGVVEHLLAALAGAEVDDCLVMLDGPEPPILDGDALSFLKLIEQAGLKEVAAPGEIIRVLRDVEAEEGQSRVALHPASDLRFYAEIDFASAAIGRQEFAVIFSPENCRRAPSASCRRPNSSAKRVTAVGRT